MLFNQTLMQQHVPYYYFVTRSNTADKRKTKTLLVLAKTEHDVRMKLALMSWQTGEHFEVDKLEVIDNEQAEAMMQRDTALLL